MNNIKDTKKLGLNLPCGNLEEMLRMMRKCREEGNVDCEFIMKEFIGKEFKAADFEEIMKRCFGDGSRRFKFNEPKKHQNT